MCGKQTRHPLNHVGSRDDEVLESDHSDIAGPMDENSLGYCRYYLSFIDDKTRNFFVYFLCTKSQENVLQRFKDVRCMAEQQMQLGIRHQTTVEYTPEQNGLAECVNRTAVERARCMLYAAKLAKPICAEALAAAVYLINRSPTKGIDITPEEAWTGRKPYERLV